MRAAVLLSAALAAGCMSRATQVSVHAVERLQVVEVAGPRARIELAVAVKTNAPVDATVTVLAHEIALAGGPPVARGGKLAPVKVPSGGIVHLTLPAEVALADLPADLPARAAGGSLAYRATVWIEADSSLGRTQHRLEPAGEAPLAQAFAAVVDGVFAEDSARLAGVTSLALEGGQVVIGMDLELPGHLPFPLHVRGVRYSAALAGALVGTGESRAPFTVEPRAGGHGHFELRVPALAVPAVVQAYARGARELLVEGSVDIEPIGPIRTVPFRARTHVR